MLSDMASEACHDCLVETFDLSIGLGVMRGSPEMLNAQKDSDYRRECGHKLWSVVKQNLGRNPVWDEPVIEEYVRAARRCYWFDWYYHPQQFVLVFRRDNYVFRTGFSPWWWTQNVHCTKCKGRSSWKQTRGLLMTGSRDLPCARLAGGHCNKDIIVNMGPVIFSA